MDLELSSSTQKKGPSNKEPAAPGGTQQSDKLEQPGEKGAEAPKLAAQNGQTGKEASEGPGKPAERSLEQEETARKAQGSAVAAKAAAHGEPCDVTVKEERAAESKGASENAAAAAGAQGKAQQKKSIATETAGSEGMPGEGLPVEREGEATEGSTKQAQMSKEAEAEHVQGEGKPDSDECKESEAKSKPKKVALAEKADSGEANKQAVLSEEPKGESAATEATAAGKDESGEAKKPAAPSDEQKVILERGASLMHEADEHDPKGIRLVRNMQVSFLCFRVVLQCAYKCTQSSILFKWPCVTGAPAAVLIYVAPLLRSRSPALSGPGSSPHKSVEVLQNEVQRSKDTGRGSSEYLA